MKDELSEAAVNPVLDTKWIGRPYYYVERAGSTNDLLKKRVADGRESVLPSGTVLLADYQETGRGRFDRSWQAPSHTSLLLSILLRPDWDASRLSWLTMLASLSVAEAVERETGLTVLLKWPNDVVIDHNGKWSKVCGILLEGALSSSEGMEYTVLGIGINVNIPLSELPPVVQPATSLMVAAGRRISRLLLLIELLRNVERNYDVADKGESPHQRWNKRLVTLGQRIKVHHVGQEMSLVGTAEATNEWGHLLVRDDDGQLHTITAGDVTLSGVKS
jgi:BirA family biotin operon repressor/biotin-[acetyl-CoA-carboxylase] ligase